MDEAAVEIHAKAVEVYTTCTSYRDSGEVVLVWDGSATNRPRTFRRPFATGFIRPLLFRFESCLSFEEGKPESGWRKYNVWRDREGAWSLPPGLRNATPERADSLELALAGATGVSLGSAFRIPFLLLDEGPQPIRVTEATSYAGTEEVNGNECFVLRRAKEGSGTAQDVTLWIDRQSLLIRRVWHERIRSAERVEEGLRNRITPQQSPYQRSETTTTYSPEIEVEIPEDKFTP